MEARDEIVRQAEAFFQKAREEKGEDTAIGFPDTAYYLPMANALMGLEVVTGEDGAWRRRQVP